METKIENFFMRVKDLPPNIIENDEGMVIFYTKKVGEEKDNIKVTKKLKLNQHTLISLGLTLINTGKEFIETALGSITEEIKFNDKKD